MLQEKYKLLFNDNIKINGITLYRIRACKSFFNVLEGELGGYIESEKNLSHSRNAWVYGHAFVYGEACVYDDALVYGNAMVFGDACIYGNAHVYGNARVYGKAHVCGNVKVKGDDIVCGYAWLRGEINNKNNSVHNDND
jgi:carbonic anhydrase/acetyltransferase-like protein (isoleucine patch superfamily)